MKKILSLIVVLFFIGSSNYLAMGQSTVMNLQGYNNEPYHFGFVLAANEMLFSFNTIDNLSTQAWNRNQSDISGADPGYVYSVEENGGPGFSVGILGNLRLGKYLDFRIIPTLSFGSRSLKYNVYDSSGRKIPTTPKKINSTYLVFPFLLKVRSWRDNNVGAYFIGGVDYSIDLAAAKKSKDNPNDVSNIYLKTNDIAVEAGAGFDFYTNYFKLGIEAKMCYGINNLIVNKNDLYSGSIKQLHSKIFMLSFIFE